MRAPAAIRAELDTVPAIASFNLERAARRIAENAMVRQLRMRADMEKAGYHLKAYIRALPVNDQLDLVDLLAHQLSEWSGSDLIGKGADSIRDEIGPQVGGEPILYLEDRAVRGMGL